MRPRLMQTHPLTTILRNDLLFRVAIQNCWIWFAFVRFSFPSVCFISIFVGQMIGFQFFFYQQKINFLLIFHRKTWKKSTFINVFSNTSLNSLSWEKERKKKERNESHIISVSDVKKGGKKRFYIIKSGVNTLSWRNGTEWSKY